MFPKIFIYLGNEENPQREHLVKLVDATVCLLEFVIESKDFIPRVWRGDEDLRKLAKDSFTKDVIPASKKLKEAIYEIPEDQLIHHGLIGSAAHFKYAVLAKTFKSWHRWRHRWTVRSGFRSLFQAVDTILDSLISATGTGVGGLIKEFKDAIMALAKA